MPRRELLTAAQRQALLAFPEEEDTLLQYYTLSVRDLATVRQHRGARNRLGFAVQLCYLRYPGRVLAEDETPPAVLLGMVAAQLQVQSDLWDEYARRDETRREHLVEIQHLYGFQPFTTRKYREIAQALISLADRTHQAMVLVRAVIDQLRDSQVIIPPLSVVERLCAEAITRAERRLYRKLTSGLSEVQRKALDNVLSVSSSTKQSMLAWLRQGPGAPNPRNILAHIERLKAIRSITLPEDPGRNIHQNHLLRLARQGAQTPANDLRDLAEDRRYATLVAMLIETSATITDEILDLNDRLLGSAFAKAKRQFEIAFQDAGRAINDKVRLYAKIGQAIIEAKTSQSDPFLAIEGIVPWERFTQTVAEAEQLARTEDFDYLSLLGESYPQLRRYIPTLLETFDFKAATAAQGELDAVTALREWNRDSRRAVPDDAPRDFVRRRWAPYVFGEKGIDRRYYELCAMSELRNRLRAGDIWVSGSRQFKRL